jgi:hypothetical protein
VEERLLFCNRFDKLAKLSFGKFDSPGCLAIMHAVLQYADNEVMQILSSRAASSCAKLVGNHTTTLNLITVHPGDQGPLVKILLLLNSGTPHYEQGDLHLRLFEAKLAHSKSAPLSSTAAFASLLIASTASRTARSGSCSVTQQQPG